MAIHRLDSERSSFIRASNGKKYTMQDLADFFKSSRGFPTILCLGKGKNKVCGEGQSGGRYVTEIAKELDSGFAKKYGKERYVDRMDRLLGKK